MSDHLISTVTEANLYSQYRLSLAMIVHMTSFELGTLYHLLTQIRELG